MKGDVYFFCKQRDCNDAYTGTMLNLSGIYCRTFLAVIMEVITTTYQHYDNRQVLEFPCALSL